MNKIIKIAWLVHAFPEVGETSNAQGLKILVNNERNIRPVTGEYIWMKRYETINLQLKPANQL